MDSILSMEMLLSTLRMAIPLVLASVGGTLCERSGIINLGIEGMMLSGAFGAVYGTYISGNPWIGVLFAILVGGLFGILHAVLCIRFKTNQSVSGIGINVFVSGLTIVLTRAVWNVVRACRWLSFHRAKQLICKRNGCRPGIHGIGRNDSRWVESFGGSVRKPCICICTGIEN